MASEPTPAPVTPLQRFFSVEANLIHLRELMKDPVLQQAITLLRDGACPGRDPYAMMHLTDGQMARALARYVGYCEFVEDLLRLIERRPTVPHERPPGAPMDLGWGDTPLEPDV